MRDICEIFSAGKLYYYQKNHYRKYENNSSKHLEKIMFWNGEKTFAIFGKSLYFAKIAFAKKDQNLPAQV